jgi:hypothetical protein
VVEDSTELKVITNGNSGDEHPTGATVDNCISAATSLRRRPWARDEEIGQLPGHGIPKEPG